jgi:HD-GYP domain-containing protein (c-di-GMP phosphodiesterase class II)
MSLDMTPERGRAFHDEDAGESRDFAALDYSDVGGRDAVPSIVERSSVLVFLENLADEIDRRQSSEGHSRDMSRWAELVALELDLDDDRQWACSTAARLHAIGKVVVPEDILNKKGPLAPEEWDLIQSHPNRGADLVRLAPGFEKVAEIIREHQERFDGTGYPAGKSAIAISLEARIVAVCGAWAAMRATRPYREALSREQARAELESGSGSEFDPEVVRAFLLLEAAEEWNRSSETSAANV